MKSSDKFSGVLTPRLRSEPYNELYRTIGCSLPENTITSANHTNRKMDGIRRNVPLLGVSLTKQLKQKVGDHTGSRAQTEFHSLGTMFYPPNLCGQIVSLLKAKIHTEVTE